MNKHLMILTGAVLCGVFAGCSTTTETFDPTNPTANTTRAIGTVSQAECLIAARAAVQDAMTDPGFVRYLQRFQREKNDNLAVPLMQVGYIKNDTNDPDLQMNLITDEICTALRKSGKVDITLATGRNATATMAEARQLKRDKNFKRDTVVKEGTLEAPTLSMEGAVISNVVRNGRETVQVYSFNLKIADIVSGREVWSYNKPLGTKETKPVLGW